MLKPDQARYLETIPKDKVVTIQPYTQHQQEVADIIIAEVKSVSPDIDIRLLGAVGLKISGQGDLDMYMLCPAADFHHYLPGLIEKLGPPLHEHPESVEWGFTRDGIEVELYLTDPTSAPMQDQLKIYEILSTDEQLRLEYEKLKADANAKPFRDYQRAKYEFYNRLLAK
jgi:hypothetical protein